MVKYSISAIAVTETWLSDSLRDGYDIPGYNFISLPRTGKSGGGVGIFLNNTLAYKCRFDLYRMLDHIECIFVEILCPNMQPIFVGCIYRPPNTDVVKFNSDMQVIMSTIDSVTIKLPQLQEILILIFKNTPVMFQRVIFLTYFCRIILCLQYVNLRE
jgi:hypothetical protein